MEERNSHKPHILAVPYPSQGHVNPMHQFCKRLSFKGAHTTFAVTKFILKSFNPKSGPAVAIEAISDGFDDGGFGQAGDVSEYLTRMEEAGSETLEDLVLSYRNSGRPIDCIVYDAFLPWALEVAKRNGIKGVAFFTQACAVNYVYYYAQRGLMELPVAAASTPVELPGLPPLELPDFPSFIHKHGTYPAYFELLLNQYSNLDKADFVVVNTFYKLEEKVSRVLLFFLILNIPSLPLN